MEMAVPNDELMKAKLAEKNEWLFEELIKKNEAFKKWNIQTK
jgi:hypothetical protein